MSTTAAVNNNSAPIVRAIPPIDSTIPRDDDSITSSIIAEDFEDEDDDIDESEMANAAVAVEAELGVQHPSRRGKSASDHSHMHYVIKRQSKSNQKFTLNDAISCNRAHIESLAEEPYCKNTRGRVKKCQCLSIFNTNPEFINPVLVSLTQWHQKVKRAQDQDLLTAYLYAEGAEDYAKALNKGRLPLHTHFYRIPYDNENCAVANIDSLRKHTICVDAFCKLHNISRKRWKRVRLNAEQSSVAKPNGRAKSSATNALMDQAKKEVPVKHFEGLIKLARFKLTVVFDNCTGQNKNNTVLKLVPYYVEMGYFQEVEFLFLIVGHTKNACDRYFNQLKRLSRRENTYTMEEMYERLADCEDVTIYRTQASDFKDMSAFLNQFYNDYSGMIKQHHIFRCTIHDIDSEEGKVYVQFRQSLLPDDEPVRMNVKKANFANKDDFVDEEAAFEYRKTIMADLESEVHVVKQKGLNPYKKYKMWSKYGSMLDESARQDPIYAKPCEEDLEKVLKERGMRKRFREDVAELKEWGDLEKTRVKREDKDKALDILDRIAGLKK